MVYTFPTYIVWICIAVAVITGVAAVPLLLARQWRYGVVAAIISLLAGFLFAPCIAMDRVVLDDEKLQQTTGFWFSPTIKGFRLAEVKQVEIGTARDRKNREKMVWNVTYKDGRSEQIDPGDLWEMNSRDIAERLRAKGIDIR
jgi:hypothetical protein